MFQTHAVDGAALLRIDEVFAIEQLGIHHALRRRRLIRAVERLRNRKKKTLQEKTLDEVDEYVIFLESHRIKVHCFAYFLPLHLPHSHWVIEPFDSLLTYVPHDLQPNVQLVAKLKSIFDRFDNMKEGRLTGEQVEQMLVYMNRPLDGAAVQDWLVKMKGNESKIEFPELVAQYTVRINFSL